MSLLVAGGCTDDLLRPLQTPNCSLIIWHSLPRLRCLFPLFAWQNSLSLAVLFRLEPFCITSQKEHSAHLIPGDKACKSSLAVKAAFLQSHGFGQTPGICQSTYTPFQISHISDFKLDFFCHAPFFDPFAALSLIPQSMQIAMSLFPSNNSCTFLSKPLGAS